MRRSRKLIIVAIAAVVGLALMGGTALARPGSQHVTDQLSSALNGLVGDGVIDEGQAQAVIEATAPLFERLDAAAHNRQQRPGTTPQQIIGAVAEQLGIELQELLQQLREGQTLADIIVAQGSSVEAVIEALSVQLQSNLDQAVADGKITTEQAEQLLASFQTRATNLIENADLTKVLRQGAGNKRDQRGHNGAPKNLGPRQVIGGLATVLGIEPQELLQQLREGQTLADIIVAQGSSVEAVIEALSVQLQSNLDQAVADGKITTEQAEQLLASFQTRATNLIENADLTNVLRQGAGNKRGQRGHDGAPRNLGPQQIIGGIATVLGIEPQELLQQLREGQTLADIIVAQDSSVEAVFEALSVQLQSNLDQAVADGKITAEQAEQLLASLQARARKVLENPGLHRGLGRHAGPAARGHSPVGNRYQARAPGRGGGVDGRDLPGGLRAIPRVSPREIVDSVRAARSRPDLAAARGVDRSALLERFQEGPRRGIRQAIERGGLDRKKGRQHLERVWEAFQRVLEDQAEQG